MLSFGITLFITMMLSILTACAKTPLLPDSKWRVHDPARPKPEVVEPGTCSTQNKPGKPPSDAIVLFDGKDLSKWIQKKTIKRKGKPNKHITRDPLWKVEDGCMQIDGDTGSIETKKGFGSCQLHVEWSAPPPRGKHGQKRGNSGVFLMGRYEIQVLDSYKNTTYADGQAAAIYGQYPPLANACRPSGKWQTYDIVFESPEFEDGELVRPAYATVFHNGVLIHHHKALQGPTVHKKLAKYRPHSDKLPLRLQDHGDPVRYRNIWIRPLDLN